MKELYCSDCTHMWTSHELTECPECQSVDVLSEADDIDIPEWDDGHFEGGFDGRYFQDDSGE